MLAFRARRRIMIIVGVALVNELAVAIAAFGRAVFAEVVIGQRMTERAAAAIAGDLVGVDIDDFGGGMVALMRLDTLRKTVADP